MQSSASGAATKDSSRARPRHSVLLAWIHRPNSEHRSRFPRYVLSFADFELQQVMNGS